MIDRCKALSAISVLTAAAVFTGCAVAETDLGSGCRDSETIYFNCTLEKSNRIISLCGSSDLGPDSGQLTFRLYSNGKLDLEHSGKSNGYRYAHYSRFRVSRSTISFDDNGRTLTIFDNYEADPPPELQEWGLQSSSSSRPDESVSELCTGDVVSRLAELENIVPCDEDDPMNFGGCS